MLVAEPGLGVGSPTPSCDPEGAQPRTRAVLRFGCLICVSGERGGYLADYHDEERGWLTEITHERRASPTAREEQSTTEQAMQKVQETGGEVRQQMGQKTQELGLQAGEGIRRQLDDRSTVAGEEVTTTADAIRRVGDQLREEGKIGTTQYAERAASLSSGWPVPDRGGRRPAPPRR